MWDHTDFLSKTNMEWFTNLPELHIVRHVILVQLVYG